MIQVVHRWPGHFLTVGKYPIPIIAIEPKTITPNAPSDAAINGDDKLSRIPEIPISVQMAERECMAGVFVPRFDLSATALTRSETSKSDFYRRSQRSQRIYITMAFASFAVFCNSHFEVVLPSG